MRRFFIYLLIPLCFLATLQLITFIIFKAGVPYEKAYISQHELLEDLTYIALYVLIAIASPLKYSKVLSGIAASAIVSLICESAFYGHVKDYIKVELPSGILTANPADFLFAIMMFAVPISIILELIIKIRRKEM